MKIHEMQSISLLENLLLQFFFLLFYQKPKYLYFSCHWKSSFSDRKNIGIWVFDKKEEKKIAAIGFRVKKWIAFHGFSLNLSNNLNSYKKIIPCGISDKGISKVDNFKKISKDKIINRLKVNLIKNLKY